MIIMRGIVKEERECWELRADCQIGGEARSGVEGAVLMVQMINAESKLLCLWVRRERGLYYLQISLLSLTLTNNIILLLIKSHASSILLFCCIVY
jgi:hypothetical protein